MCRCLCSAVSAALQATDDTKRRTHSTRRAQHTSERATERQDSAGSGTWNRQQDKTQSSARTVCLGEGGDRRERGEQRTVAALKTRAMAAERDEGTAATACRVPP